MIKIPHLTQITESHCGPAVMEMLLHGIHISCDQELIAKAANAETSIEAEGTRIDQLGLATHRVAPEAQFWYKFHSSIEDIEYLLDQGFAVGVEWQGLFYDTEEEEPDKNYGHYAIVTQINRQNGSVIIVDPYKDFAGQDRMFPITMFVRRWWDTNDILDPKTGKKKVIEDHRALFFVTPKNTHLPEEMGFKKFLPYTEMYSFEI